MNQNREANEISFTRELCKSPIQTLTTISMEHDII